MREFINSMFCNLLDEHKNIDGFVDFRERVFTPWMRALRVKDFQFNFVPENFFESMKKYGYTTQNTVWLDMYSNRIFC